MQEREVQQVEEGGEWIQEGKWKKSVTGGGKQSKEQKIGKKG